MITPTGKPEGDPMTSPHPHTPGKIQAYIITDIPVDRVTDDTVGQHLRQTCERHHLQLEDNGFELKRLTLPVGTGICQTRTLQRYLLAAHHDGDKCFVFTETQTFVRGKDAKTRTPQKVLMLYPVSWGAGDVPRISQPTTHSTSRRGQQAPCLAI